MSTRTNGRDLSEVYNAPIIRRGALLVFSWMSLGLTLSGVAAMLATSRPDLMDKMGGIWMLFLVLLGISFYVQLLASSMPLARSMVLFTAYAACIGLAFGILAGRYLDMPIAATFFVLAGMFGAMVLYGVVKQRYVYSPSSLLLMAGIGAAASAGVSLRMQGGAVHWIVTYTGLLAILWVTGCFVFFFERWVMPVPETRADAATLKGTIASALILYAGLMKPFVMIAFFVIRSQRFRRP